MISTRFKNYKKKRRKERRSVENIPQEWRRSGFGEGNVLRKRRRSSYCRGYGFPEM